MSEHTRSNISWAVEYDDGTIVEQYKKREQDNLEVPLRTIEWGRTRRVMFESESMKYSYVLPPLDEELQWSMRIRHLMSLSGAEVLVMILLASLKDQEVNEDSVIFALYVTPDGIIHFCDEFNCPHIPDYYHGKVNKIDVTVPTMSWRTKTKASALLTEFKEE